MRWLEEDLERELSKLSERCSYNNRVVSGNLFLYEDRVNEVGREGYDVDAHRGRVDDLYRRLVVETCRDVRDIWEKH